MRKKYNQNKSVADIFPGIERTFLEYMGEYKDSAMLIAGLDSKGGLHISPHVLLGSRFYGFVPYRQGVSLFHEMLHYHYQLNDADLFSHLKIKKITGMTESYSISNFISSGCHEALIEDRKDK
jgi:hypothetical protein